MQLSFPRRSRRFFAMTSTSDSGVPRQIALPDPVNPRPATQSREAGLRSPEAFLSRQPKDWPAQALAQAALPGELVLLPQPRVQRSLYFRVLLQQLESFPVRPESRSASRQRIGYADG